MQFMNPANPKNRTLCRLWNSKIKGSLQTALDTVYPVLKKTKHLDQVFKYQSLPALAARIKRWTDAKIHHHGLGAHNAAV
jgi:hypothetical protein